MSKLSPQQLRLSLQAVCASLRSLGVSELTPEVLIQAKSGGPVADVLSRALHDLVVLRLAGWPAADSSFLRQYWTQLDSEGEDSGLPTQGQQLVTSYLQQQGFIRSRSYTDGTYHDTREMLLALGWFVAETHALQQALQQHIHNFSFTALLPPYPQDGLQSRAATQSAQRSQLMTQRYLQQAKQVCTGNQGWAKVQVSCDHALMLLKKSQANLRSLQSLHQSRHRLCHGIFSAQDHKQTSKQKGRCAMSPYELGLLKSQDQLQQHYNSLQQAAVIVAACSEAQGHCHIFLQWLADVDHLHGQDQSCKTSSSYTEAAADAQTRGSFELQQHAAGSDLQQLESTAVRLQHTLQEMLYQADKLDMSAAGDAGSCPPSLRQPAGQAILQQDLPPDIKTSIGAAYTTADLPWHSWQPCAEQMVHFHHAQTSVLADNTQTAAAEADRLTAAVLDVAKLLSKSRARHKHDLQLSTEYLACSSGLQVRL